MNREMTRIDDMELVREYAATRSEAVFSEIVARHIALVYSAAVRQVRDPHRAEEITQNVFLLLARKAPLLDARTILSGWLYRTARNVAADFLKSERRRLKREHEAHMQAIQADQSGEAEWNQAAPLLDEAMSKLGDADRDALILRYFENKSAREVAQALRVEEGAAQKRINRAVEKLRRIFSRKGVVLSASLLSAISARAVEAAPPKLAGTVIASLPGAATASVLSVCTAKTIAWLASAKTQMAMAAGLVALLTWQACENYLLAGRIEGVEADIRSDSAAETLHRARIAASLTMADAASAREEAQKRELENLQARVKKDEEELAAGVFGIPGMQSPISRQLAEPRAREQMRQGLLGNYRARYADLFKQLKLSPERQDRFLEAFTEIGMKNLDATAAVNDGKMTQAQASLSRMLSSVGEWKQASAFLGEGGDDAFREFSASFPGRELARQLEGQMAEQLSPEQRERLIQVIRGQPLGVTTGLAGDFDIGSLTSREALEERARLQTQVAGRILNQAASFLTADQLEALGALQTNIINRQQFQGGKSLKKF